MKRLFLAVLILAFARPAGAATAPMTIDVILPLTGPTAFAGHAQEQAARVYEGLVNKSGGIHGQNVHFELHDDQSSPTIAVQIVNDLLTRHPVVVLGPSVSGDCAAIAPLFVNGPVNFCFSPALTPARGGYVFASSTPQKSLLYAGYARIHALGYKRVATIIETDASGQLEMQYTKDAFSFPSNKGMDLVAMESFAPNDLSVAAQVAKIKAARPDIIYVWANGTAFGTAIRELDNAGLSVLPIVTPPANTSEAQMAQYKAFLPKMLITAGMPYQGKMQNPAMKAAATEYLDGMKEANIKPETFQAYAWDAMKITVAALRKLPAGATSAQLRDYIEGLNDFAGLWGVYDFRTGDQHGLDGNDVPYLVLDSATHTWSYFDVPPAKS